MTPQEIASDLEKFKIVCAKRTSSYKKLELLPLLLVSKVFTAPVRPVCFLHWLEDLVNLPARSADAMSALIGVLGANEALKEYRGILEENPDYKARLEHVLTRLTVRAHEEKQWNSQELLQLHLMLKTLGVTTDRNHLYAQLATQWDVQKLDKYCKLTYDDFYTGAVGSKIDG